MEGLVTLLFFNLERRNLINWSILMCIFQKLSILKIQGSMTSLRRHNGCIFERPCNFAIFDGKSPKFCKLYYFDVFF